MERIKKLTKKPITKTILQKSIQARISIKINQMPVHTISRDISNIILRKIFHKHKQFKINLKTIKVFLPTPDLMKRKVLLVIKSLLNINKHLYSIQNILRKVFNSHILELSISQKEVFLSIIREKSLHLLHRKIKIFLLEILSRRIPQE